MGGTSLRRALKLRKQDEAAKGGARTFRRVFASSPDGVQWALRAGLPVLEHVGVDLRGAEVVMTEQVLDGADVGAVGQGVGRKRVLQPKTTSSLRSGRSV